MASLRDMLDNPERHPDLETAVLGFKPPVRVIQAGGPGSGRHKQNYEVSFMLYKKLADGLEKHGFQFKDLGKGGNFDKTYWKHPDGHSATYNQDRNTLSLTADKSTHQKIGNMVDKLNTQHWK